MKVNIYLPDELGARAKADDLPLSQMLRRAVERHYEEAAMSTTMEDAQTFELDLTDDQGRPYVGRITGNLIASCEGCKVFLTADRRVLAINEEISIVNDVSADPEAGLRSLILGDEAGADETDVAAYIAAMRALGKAPVIDL